MRKIRNIARYRWAFLGLFCLCFIGLYMSLREDEEIWKCFQKQLQNIDINSNDTTEPYLLADILQAVHPPLGRSIFFHETSCRSFPESHFSLFFNLMKPKPLHVNIANLTAREACAVESAALHNPNFEVYVLYASPAYWMINHTSNPIMNAILSYPNVKLRNVNLWSYAANTPIAEWFNTGEIFKSSYVLSHISDFLRYLTLWRWGGIYLDMDVVVLRNLEEVPPNYTGAESENYLAAGVMNFAPDGIGHKVAEFCLEDFQRNFDGSDWGNNGPGVITRALKHLCQTDNIYDMFDQKRCLGFKVFEQDAFYAIPWKRWKLFFDAHFSEYVVKHLKHSYVAHVWNKHSKNIKHRIGEPGAYGELALLHCPKVYFAVDEYF